MSDDIQPLPTDYETLAAELKKLPGATEMVVRAIQDGLELEAFASTKAGALMIGSAIAGMITHLQIILDPNISGEKLQQAVAELRVRHRMLVFYEETVQGGKAAAQRLEVQSDNPEESL